MATMADAPRPGGLLVASPAIGDPNFERTVVLLLEHGADGALGLVLNRPSEIDLVDPLPEWTRLAAHPPVVFVGGPVEPERAIALARRDPSRTPDLTTDVYAPVLGELGTLDLTCDPDLVGGGIDALRVFSGYAGWGPGQLDGELAAGAWWIVDAEPGDAVAIEPAGLWRAVLARQRGPLHRFANYPDDPSTN